jgi:ABC-2 type transport system permease protein
MRRYLTKENKALVSELVRTDFKLRYQGSALGYIWSLLRPLLLFVILYIVFVKLLKLGNGVPHYPVYLLVGIVMWNYFYEMTVLSLGSIVSRGDLIRKISIPRWSIVLSTSISATINLLLNILVIIVFMIINHVPVDRGMVWLPLLFVEVYLFALGLSLFLSAAFVKYRDISYIWEVLLQAGFYATPVLYPLSRITNLTFRKIILLNPMAQILQEIRYVTITHQTITANQVFKGQWFIALPFILILVVLFLGLVYFRKQSKYFAENI